MREDAAQGGQWRLIDFGLSKKAGELKAAQSHISTRTIIGTPGYIAKEFMETGHMSPACDVYSLGVTILAVATGLPVYKDGNHLPDLVAYLRRNLESQPGDPSTLLLQSALASSSADWSFSGGSEALLQLLGLGAQCAEPAKLFRPALPQVARPGQ